MIFDQAAIRAEFAKIDTDRSGAITKGIKKLAHDWMRH